MTIIPTMHLAFVKRRVGRNVVRILQQKWIDETLPPADQQGEWRDVPMRLDGEATKGEFPPVPD